MRLEVHEVDSIREDGDEIGEGGWICAYGAGVRYAGGVVGRIPLSCSVCRNCPIGE